MSRLTELSIKAQERAERLNLPSIEAMREFMWAPMVVVGDYAVFDVKRLRDDQVDDLVARLEELTDGGRKWGLRDGVEHFMEAYGTTGVRVADVMEALGTRSKASVLRYLRDLIDQGIVEMREEKNPRPGGTRRKRYYYRLAPLGNDLIESYGLQEEGMHVRSGGLPDRFDMGIVHHGTPNGACQCPCGDCASSFARCIEAECVSAARVAGGSGLAEGVYFQTQRRLAAEARYGR